MITLLNTYSIMKGTEESGLRPASMLCASHSKNPVAPQFNDTNWVDGQYKTWRVA